MFNIEFEYQSSKTYIQAIKQRQNESNMLQIFSEDSNGSKSAIFYVFRKYSEFRFIDKANHK